MIKKIYVTAALLLPSLAHAGTPSADLSAQTVPTVQTPPSGGTPLLGLYQGDNTNPAFHVWAGRYPDFTINYSQMGPGAGGNNPSNNNGYPVLVAFGHLDANYPDANAAANGLYNSAYAQTVSSFIAPYASKVYAIRVDSEWQGNWSSYSPWYNGSESSPTITPATWIAGVRNLIAQIKANPATANIPIEFDAPNTDVENNYYIGDDVVNFIGFDKYFDSNYYPNSSAAWANETTRTDCCNINTMASFARAHGKLMIVPEWCDTFTDGYIIPLFAAWMAANNVIAQSYWDSSDAIGAAGGCRLLDYPAREQAYINAFGNTHYTGSYWKLIPVPSTSGY
jgi:hypothetical protein